MFVPLGQQREQCQEMKWLNAHVIINVGHLNHHMVFSKCNFFQFFLEFKIIALPFIV